MHVEEGASSSGCAKIEVVDCAGDSRIIALPADCTIEQLKLMAVSAFHTDLLTCGKRLHQFRLILLSKRRRLREGSSVREEDVVDGDIVLLLPQYPSAIPVHHPQREAGSRIGPSDAEILTATASLPFKNLNRPARDPGNMDFQRELRKILVTLIDFAAKLLHADPEVEPIIRSIPSTTSRIEDAEAKKKEEDVSEPALQQLVDMGFGTEKAKRALKLNNMSPVEAMDWLLAYDSSTQVHSFPGSGLIPSAMHMMQQQQQHQHQQRAEADASGCVYPAVEGVVQGYRTFKRRTFKVNSKAVGNLKQMGFEEEEVLDALWVHTNNEVAACEWLLSERRPNREDLRMGLTPRSPVHRSLMNDATLQLGLLKPRTLFSLLHLLHEPNSMGRWLNDSDTAPVLSQVFRIYHSEKHATVPPDDEQDRNHDGRQQSNADQVFQTDV